MGAEHIRSLLLEKKEYDREASPRKVDEDRLAGDDMNPADEPGIVLDHEREDLEDQVKNGKGQRQARAVKRLKVLSAFLNSDNKPEHMVLEAVPHIGSAIEAPAGRMRAISPTIHSVRRVLLPR